MERCPKCHDGKLQQFWVAGLMRYLCSWCGVVLGPDRKPAPLPPGVHLVGEHPKQEPLD